MTEHEAGELRRHNGPLTETQSGTSDTGRESSTPQLAEQVFELFKGYLTSQLEKKRKQIKTESKIEKEACDFKFKGNRKQFEFNSSLDTTLTEIANNADNPEEVTRLVGEGKEKISKRQKLVKLADRNKDGWLVVQEYESDDLASDSEDEKKIRKAKNAAEKKRKDAKSHSSGSQFKKSKTGGDYQLFRGKIFPVF